MTTKQFFPLFLALTGIAAGAAPVSIHNEALSVSYEFGRFSVSDAKSGKQFAQNLTIRGAKGDGKIVVANDAAFGKGQAIEVATSDGGTARVAVFRELPFALIRATIVNNVGSEAIQNKVPLMWTVLDLGKPASELKTLGTGGLADAEKNPGSYAWLAVADPTTRVGVVTAWLTHDRACGIVTPRVENGKIQVEARGEYGRLWMKNGDKTETETLAIGYFDDARLGLEAWADAVAKKYAIKLPAQPTGYCTWYSDKHGGAGDEKSIVELAEFAAKNLKDYGFTYVQIDDQWQAGTSKNGPNRNFTEVKTNGPYRGGMKAPADEIKKLGLTPGIWFMPFSGTHDDPYFKKEWFVKRPDGSPYDTAWGGTSLDMTQPGAREHLKEVATKLGKEWGYTFFKMDGLSTGIGTKPCYVNSGYKEDGMGDGVFADPDQSNIEAYRSGLKLVRETAGPDVFFLGCCAPQNMRSFAGTFGLVDAMRIGPDNGGNWKGWAGVSPVFGTRNYFLNGRVWYNDPDPIYARGSIPLNEVKTMCSWTAIAGALNASSDWMPALTPDRIDVLRRTMPPHGLLTARPVDLFENDPAQIWTLRDDRGGMRRDIIALYNWKNESQDFDIPLAKLGLDEKSDHVAFEFSANEFTASVRGSLKAEVAPHGCKIFAIRTAQKNPQLISTSRHVTQGIVDVLEEKWDAATYTLSGRSKVVANDPYELRIATSARVESAEAAGATATTKDEPGLVRVTVSPVKTGEISWSIRFAK